MITVGRSLSFPMTEARLSSNPDVGRRFLSSNRRRHFSIKMDVTSSASIPRSSSYSEFTSCSSLPKTSPPPPTTKTKLVLKLGPTLSVRFVSTVLAVVRAFFLLLLSTFLFARLSVDPPDEEQRMGTVKQKKTKKVVLVKERKNRGKDVLERRELAFQRVRSEYDVEGIDEDGRLSIREPSLFVTERGDTLFTQSWSPVTVKLKGLVILLHGLNEHSSRYNRFAKQLNTKGFKVYAMDWIGHGGSDVLHGYVPSLDYAVNDMKAYLKDVLDHNPGLPCFCFGHSTGGAIVLKAALDPKVKELIKGVVVTSPAVHVQPSHPIVKVLAPIISFLAPMYQLDNREKPGMPVSRDPNALVTKYSDPLVFTGSIRVRTGCEIFRITSFLQRNLTEMSVPFLVLHGTCDTVTDPEASKTLHQKASSSDKSIKLYRGYLHDLLFEPERDDIAADIIDWLMSRTQ